MTLSGEILFSKPFRFSSIEELEKITMEQYLMADESGRQKIYEKKLSDVEKLKNLAKRIEEGNTYLSSRFYQIAKKYRLNKNIIEKAIETGDRKKFEICLKEIENCIENGRDVDEYYFKAWELSDKYSFDGNRIIEAAEMGGFLEYFKKDLFINC